MRPPFIRPSTVAVVSAAGANAAGPVIGVRDVGRVALTVVGEAPALAAAADEHPAAAVGRHVAVELCRLDERVRAQPVDAVGRGRVVLLDRPARRRRRLLRRTVARRRAALATSVLDPIATSDPRVADGQEERRETATRSVAPSGGVGGVLFAHSFHDVHSFS